MATAVHTVSGSLTSYWTWKWLKMDTYSSRLLVHKHILEITASSGISIYLINKLLMDRTYDVQPKIPFPDLSFLVEPWKSWNILDQFLPSLSVMMFNMDFLAKKNMRRIRSHATKLVNKLLGIPPNSIPMWNMSLPFWLLFGLGNELHCIFTFHEINLKTAIVSVFITCQYLSSMIAL